MSRLTEIFDGAASPASPGDKTFQVDLERGQMTTTRKRERPNISVEIVGYMPPNREDHADSPKMIRDFLNKSASRPESARSDHFDPASNGFNATYRLPCTPASASHVRSPCRENPAQKGDPLNTEAPSSRGYHAQENYDFEGMTAYAQHKKGHTNDPARDLPLMPVFVAEPVVRRNSVPVLKEYAWSPTQSEDSSSDISAPDIADPSPESSKNLGELHDSIAENQHNITYTSGLEDPMGFADYPDDLSTDSLKTSSGFLSYSGAPYLDVAIPDGAFGSGPISEISSSSQHELFTGGRQTSHIISSRFSGIVSERSSERYMNHNEIGESLLLFKDSGRLVDTTTRVPSFPKVNDTATQGDSRGANAPVYAKDLHPNGDITTITIDGPGSSQTSSSPSKGGMSGEVAAGALEVSSDRDDQSKMRSPTPNLLWGRRAIKSIDNDWETVSDFRGKSNGVVGKTCSEAQTGSSLANNSDFEEASFNEHSQHLNTPSLSNSQFTTQPRPNQAFVFIRNSQTGRVDCLPQRRFNGNHAFNLGPGGALASANTTDIEYRHPTPLTTVHTHPSLSIPSAIRPIRDMAASARGVRSLSQLQAALTASSISEPSSDVVMVTNPDDQKVLQDVTKDGLDTDEALEEEEHGGRERDDKACSFHSSAWLSTVSEGKSGSLSFPDHQDRVGSFAKVTILGSKGNITGTPEGTGAREVGSSIADASSQGAKFSSPAPFGSSPFSPPPRDLVGSSISQQARNYVNMLDDPFSTTPQHYRSAYDNTLPTTPQYAHSYHSASGNPFSTPTASPTSSTGPGAIRLLDLSTNTKSLEIYEHKYGETRKVRGQRKKSPRSSSESEARVKSSSTTQKASGLPTPGAKGHRHRSTAADSLQRETLTHSDSEISRTGTSEAAPSLDHLALAYGVRPWDSFSAHSRPIPHSSSYVRPIARAESPHLYRIPRQPNPETLARQEQLSFWILVPTCVIPPIALLYGYGLMDGIIGQATSGEIKQFDEWHKFFARCWGFGATGTVILAIVVAMLVIST